MIILVDCDVLIDLALQREPFVDPAAELLDTLQKRPGTAFVAWHTIFNFYYLVRGPRGSAQTKAFLLDLSRFIDIAPTDTESLVYASSLELTDFVDAMQVSAARACKADLIATRNLKDYKRSPIPALAPSEVARALAEIDP